MLTIDSAATIANRNLDGRTTPRLVDTRTKTAERHTVTVRSETARIWADLGAKREEWGPYVFNLGDDPASPDRIGWWWTKARASSGIDKRWRLHDLRHFSATIAIAEGHDVRTVAHRLGHADPAMTLLVYAHAVASVDQAVADSLGRVLQGTPPPTDAPSDGG